MCVRTPDQDVVACTSCVAASVLLPFASEAYFYRVKDFAQLASGGIQQSALVAFLSGKDCVVQSRCTSIGSGQNQHFYVFLSKVTAVDLQMLQWATSMHPAALLQTCCLLRAHLQTGMQLKIWL
jgi:hypothetical protein